MIILKIAVDWLLASAALSLIFSPNYDGAAIGGVVITVIINIVVPIFKKIALKREISKYRADLAERPVDELTPYEFEEYVAELFRRDGCVNVYTTSKSGDFGADVIGIKNGEKFCVQCKYHSTPVGVKAVQEIIGAREYYKCSKAYVYSISGYTDAAHKMAKKSNVKLVNLIPPKTTRGDRKHQKPASDSDRYHLPDCVAVQPNQDENVAQGFIPFVSELWQEHKRVIIAIAIGVLCCCIFLNISKHRQTSTAKTYNNSVISESSVRPESGEIITDFSFEKPSKGIFTNELDSDITVACFYPSTNSVIFEFYLHAGDTVELDMPYATLFLYVKKADKTDEYYLYYDGVPFSWGQTTDVVINKDSLTETDSWPV